MSQDSKLALKMLAGMVAVLILLPARQFAIWNLWTCAAQWCIVGFTVWVLVRPAGSLTFWSVSFGTALNAAATLANGGRMPAWGAVSDGSIWTPVGSNTRLLFLCDIHHGWSLGDIIILVGLALAVCMRAWNYVRPYQKVAVLE